MGTLPDEVVERLCTCGSVKLVTGPDDVPHRVDAALAPLHRQLFAFVSRGGKAEQNLLVEPRAEIHADDPAGEWSIRVRGRAVAGRVVNADPRRNELVHWLPEGGRPHDLVATRLHPEFVEYTKGKGADRTRAAGPVPEGAAPPTFTRWIRLATEGVIPVYAVGAVGAWLYLIPLEEDPNRRLLLLSVMGLAAVALLAGETLWDHANRFDRWREGLEDEAAVGLLLQGWAAPTPARNIGRQLMIAGVGIAVLASVGAGWRIGLGAVLLSGVPALLPYHLLRHVLRRRDAASEAS